MAATAARLDALAPDLPTVLVNHWPLVREPCDVLWYPEFALWCGTTATADWPAATGPGRSCTVTCTSRARSPSNGVPFVEVSLGYPREWRRHSERIGGHFPDQLPRTVLPAS
nr:hypothetical protein [Pseudonocardia sp. ICBG601]